MKSVAIYVLGLVTLPVLAIIAAFLGLLPSSATPAPPRWELLIAGRALDSSLEHRASGLANPISGKNGTALAGADQLFDRNCSSCHGNREQPSSLTFYPRAPQFFQEGESDLEPAEAYAAIRGGIRYSAMPAWSARLSDAEMWKLANFVANAREKEGAGKAPAKDSD